MIISIKKELGQFTTKETYCVTRAAKKEYGRPLRIDDHQKYSRYIVKGGWGEGGGSKLPNNMHSCSLFLS